MSYTATAARAAHVLCQEPTMSRDDLQPMLVDLGLPEPVATRFMDSVPAGNEGDVMASSFIESVFGQDGAAAAYLVQHGATAVSEDDIASLNSQPALARASSSQVRGDVTCPCCLGGFWHPVRTPCGHAFCMECLKTWLENSANKTCPMCRTAFGAWRPTPADVDAALERATQAAFGNILEQREAEEAATAAQREAEEAAKAAAAVAEQERIETLLASPDAFAIRIGHRTYGSRGRLQNLYVEPVNKTLPLHLLVSQVRFEFHPNQCVSYTVAGGPKFERQRVRQHIVPCFKVHIIWKDGLDLDPLVVRIDNLHGERAQRASEIRVLRLCQFYPSRHARASFNQFRECLESSVAENSTRRPAAGNSTRRPAAGNSTGAGNSFRRPAGNSPRLPTAGVGSSRRSQI